MSGYKTPDKMGQETKRAYEIRRLDFKISMEFVRQPATYVIGDLKQTGF